MTHGTPRMHQRPDDPAYVLLKDHLVSTPRVHRARCHICEDMEYARMGLPLCSPCCACRTGHIPADDSVCDDCGHEVCPECAKMPAAPVCTCDTPCCEADVGIGTVTCGGQHCPTHGYQEDTE